MKKFLIIATVLLLIVSGIYYLYFYQGFYLAFGIPEVSDAPFRTEGKQIMTQTEDGAWKALELRGVDISASLPGRHMSDFAPSREDYLRWLTCIGEMGANTVRASTILDADFYSALHTYNTQSPQPIYLLQGIQVPDAANFGDEDAYHREFLGHLLEESRKAVDVVHGRRMDPLGGYYLTDVSQWTLGYLVGHDWNADTVAYTDHSIIRTGEYQGTYFTASAEATPFEAMLAQVMDELVTYETGKYSAQRLVGFVNAQAIDMLIFNDVSARQYEKYAHLDPEHVLPTEALVSGYYAAYRLVDYCDDFQAHLLPEQREELAPILAGIDPESAYGGYLQLLGRYHTMPLIAAGYGFSTARGATGEDDPPLTEEAQGRSLVWVWQEAMEAGWSGVFVSTWQDQWELRTWNTAFATALTDQYLWPDLQTANQHYGLLAFEAGTAVLDGEPGEWADETPLLVRGELRLYARYDREGLWLMIEGPELEELYLPMDMLDTIGSTSSLEPQVTFQRASEFLLCLEGPENSRLLVQERYDPARVNFLYETQRLDPFIREPEADSDSFSICTMAISRRISAQVLLQARPEELQVLRAYGLYETGRLVPGNGDPESESYNSLADICYGEGCVELRLPWLLLNVADPAEMLIHDDPYAHYGIELRSCDGIWIGLGTQGETIPMTWLELEPLGKNTRYQERLKDSYYILQEYWS